MSAGAVAAPMGPAPRPDAATRPVREVMRHGVVVCDADASARDVARTVRDHRVRSVMTIDISSELIGLVDEGALVHAWKDPDGTPAISLADNDVLTVDPDEPVGDVARKMLAAGVTRALVAPPAPPEESGLWSEWKERGLPLGVISVADILARLDDLEAAVRSAPSRRASAGRRAAPWIAVAVIVVVLALAALFLFGFLQGTHQYTNKPGL
jgi:CBS domain-containing protein